MSDASEIATGPGETMGNAGPGTVSYTHLGPARAGRKNYRKSHRAGKERSSTGAQRYVTDSLSLQGRELAVAML